jgi:hypothetical protein
MEQKKNISMKSLSIGILSILLFGCMIPCITASKGNEINQHNNVMNTSITGRIQFYETGNRISQVIIYQERDMNALNQIITTLEQKLNTVTTREETITAFNDAIIELSNHRFLPKGMSTAEAQRLVSTPSIAYQQEAASTEANSFCFIAGRSWNTYFSNFATNLLLEKERVQAYKFAWHYVNFKPIQIGSTINFGFESRGYNPAGGWIFTLGDSGILKTRGYFSGGAQWFTGIQIRLPFPVADSNLFLSHHFYLGTALQVNLDM